MSTMLPNQNRGDGGSEAGDSPSNTLNMFYLDFNINNIRTYLSSAMPSIVNIMLKI